MNNVAKKSLGRGLNALLGDDYERSVSRETSEVKSDSQISIDKLYPSKFQPRTEFNDEAIESLAASIKEKGVLQPLIVRDDNNGKFEIVAGERRWRASKLAGLEVVPVIVKKISDSEALEIALVENIIRENLNPVEEAEGLDRLVKECNHTQEAISKIVGKSRSYVANSLRLLTLPLEVKKMLNGGELTSGHARTLVGREDAVELAKTIVKKNLNVRQAEELTSKADNKKIKTKNKKNLELLSLEDDLTKSIGYKVKIQNSTKGGKIVLHYNNMEDLDKIIEMLDGKSNKQSNIEVLDWREGLDVEEDNKDIDVAEDIVDNKAWSKAIQPDDGTEKNEEFAPYID
jgi:ParB family chromosome partitioning protein